MGEVNTRVTLEPGYTEEELYDLFCKFYKHRGALRILSELMGYSHKEYARGTYERFMARKSGAVK